MPKDKDVTPIRRVAHATEAEIAQAEMGKEIENLEAKVEDLEGEVTFLGTLIVIVTESADKDRKKLKKLKRQEKKRKKEFERKVESRMRLAGVAAGITIGAAIVGIITSNPSS